MFARERAPIPADEVPRSLSATSEGLLQRRFLSMQKWLCVPRPQYSSSCGMSSVCAVWNCLFSSLGAGDLPPLAVEEVGEILGFRPPLRSHGLFYIQTNSALLRWFTDLCAHTGVRGDSRILLKLQGSRKTAIEPETAFWRVCEDVRDPNAALIYHCEGHFMTIVGYEVSPTLQTDAGKSPSEICIADTEPWILAGESNGKKAPLHSIRWSEVLTDLSLLYPTYFDVRRPEYGVQQHRSRLYTEGEYAGRNIHCIMEFRRCI